MLLQDKVSYALTFVLCVHIMKGCLLGPLVMTQVKLRVDPLLKKTSALPKISVFGSEKNGSFVVKILFYKRLYLIVSHL